MHRQVGGVWAEVRVVDKCRDTSGLWVGERGQIWMGLRGWSFQSPQSHPGRGHPTETGRARMHRQKEGQTDGKAASPNRREELTEMGMSSSRGTHRTQLGRCQQGAGGGARNKKSDRHSETLSRGAREGQSNTDSEAVGHMGRWAERPLGCEEPRHGLWQPGAQWVARQGSRRLCGGVQGARKDGALGGPGPTSPGVK